MERVEPDGSRRPLEPGEVANVDQLGAQWRELTTQLLALHIQAQALAQDPGADGQTLADVGRQLRRLLEGGLQGRQDIAMNYVMFLIELLDTARQRHEFIAGSLQGLAAATDALLAYAGGDEKPADPNGYQA